jgi:hypothetical protein
VFPRGGWIDRYLEQGARYFFIHEGGFDDSDLIIALERLEAHPDLIRIGRFTHEQGAVWVYAERRTQGLGAGR